MVRRWLWRRFASNYDVREPACRARFIQRNLYLSLIVCPYCNRWGDEHRGIPEDEPDPSGGPYR